MADTQPLPTAALVREAIDTALVSVDALELQARDTARRFRRLAVTDAQASLAQVIESTQTLLKLAVATASACGTDVTSECTRHGLTVESDTRQALSAMIGRQLEHDWHGLARVIEQSFIAALRGWQHLFRLFDEGTGPWGDAA